MIIVNELESVPIFGKVTELEWYLACKNMTEFLLSNNLNPGIRPVDCESLRLEKSMTFGEFHEFWSSMVLPRYDAETGEYILFSPMNLNILLNPGGNFELPLGSYPLQEGFHICQSFSRNPNLVFSIQKIQSDTGGMGYSLSISSISDSPIPIRLERDQELIRGCFTQPEEAAEEIYQKARLRLTEDVPPDSSVQLCFYLPGVFDVMESSTFPMDHVYVSGEQEQTGEVRFFIQMQKKEFPCPLSDPILDIVSSDHIHKYSFLKRPQGVSAREIFEEKFKRITANEDIITFQKRYLLPIKGRQWILLSKKYQA